MSHIFFADDLVFFGEASLETARAMRFVLNEFCLHSGHKVSLSKSKLCFTLNTEEGVHRSIGQTLGFQQTVHLGVYLGFSLFHSRVTRSSFQFIVDKVQ